MPIVIQEPAKRDITITLPSKKSFFEPGMFRFTGEYTVLDLRIFTESLELTDGLTASIPFETDTGKVGIIKINLKKSLELQIPEYDIPILQVRKYRAYDDKIYLYLICKCNTKKIMPRIQLYTEWSWKVNTGGYLSPIAITDYADLTRIQNITHPLYGGELSYVNGLDGQISYLSSGWDLGVGFQVSYPTDTVTYAAGFLHLRVLARTSVSDKPMLWTEVELYNDTYGLVSDFSY